MKRLNDYITEFININNIRKHRLYETVDLDLPSGIKWATCNIGAENPEDYGLLFQWGRTDGYKYDDENHGFLDKKNFQTTSGTQYTKGDTLKPEDDAAYQATNGELRMPTADEFNELLKYTTHQKIKLNDKYVFKFTSKKDDSKYIIIPYSGWYIDMGDKSEFRDLNTTTSLWSSSCMPRFVNAGMTLYFYATNAEVFNNSAYDALSVRGVLNK